MKKLFAILMMTTVCSFFFAQDKSFDVLDENKKIDTSVQVIVPENPHFVTDVTGKAPANAAIRIEFIQGYDEARVYYSCMEIAFEKSDAMTTIAECLEDFQVAHQYFHYKYLRPDRVRYYTDARGIKMAEYVSFVKFTQ